LTKLNQNKVYNSKKRNFLRKRN